MKINVGCGRHVLDGWVNVDVERAPSAKRAPEVLADARSIPLEDGCADVLMAIHLWEHFYVWESEAVLAEWRRLLKPGGLLILELPDLIKCCRNIVEGTDQSGKHQDQLGLWGLYGDPREKNHYMCHKWAWSSSSLKQFLADRGFIKVVEKKTEWHSTGRDNRDMRIEAVKA